MSDDAPLLRVSGLRVDLATAHHSVNVVTDVSIHVRAGETLALVGESGCGKSLTALAIMRLLSAPLAMSGGTIEFSGQRLDQLEEEACRRIRGAAMSMVFQEPMTALNPVYRVGEQIAEVVQVHQNVSRVEAVTRAVDSLATVGIADAAERARLYPHELSGGMKQRVMIAMALVCEPILLIADEPTTALDVTIQAQILALLRSARQRRGLGLLLITHDLGVVAQHADRVAIMYA
ncbi:MAG: ABC transporter ATP-binding protein, partial [Chromatiales bacterium]|nr:ABC transporter ATP-binding protein [Chromatiales bacterium]